MMPKESNDTYYRTQITLLVGSFDPFKGVILDINDYTPKGVI